MFSPEIFCKVFSQEVVRRCRTDPAIKVIFQEEVYGYGKTLAYRSVRRLPFTYLECWAVRISRFDLLYVLSPACP